MGLLNDNGEKKTAELRSRWKEYIEGLYGKADNKSQDIFNEVGYMGEPSVMEQGVRAALRSDELSMKPKG